jgi:hypothetical protein
MIKMNKKYNKNEKLLSLLNNKFKLKQIAKSAKTPLFIINLKNFFLRDHEKHFIRNSTKLIWNFGKHF